MSSFGARESGQRRMGSLTPLMLEKDEDLALFLEMRRLEKEQSDLQLQNHGELDYTLASKEGNSPIFDISAATTAAPVRRTGVDDFLNSENDKNDYDWLLSPPDTPLFPSLERESQKTLTTSKARPTAVKSKVVNAQTEPTARSNIASRQAVSSVGLNSSSAHRPSSSGGSGSRPGTPNGQPTLTKVTKPARNTSKPALTTSKPALTTSKRALTTPKPALTTPKPALATSKPASTTSKLTSSRVSNPMSNSASKPTRSLTPTSRATLPSPSTKPGPPASSMPTARSSTRSSTPTSRPTIPASKASSRSATPTRRPITPSSVASATSVKPAPPSITKSVSTTTRNSVPARASSPSVKSRPWNPSEMPGFSLNAPPNLRTTLPDRPISATRGRPGVPSVRSSSVEPVSNGRVRRQSCSPARGRPPNGFIHGSGSSVPAMNRAYAKAKDNISPVVVGTKMVERVINMRKLAPPKKDDNHSPASNLSGKTSSPDSLGIGRTLSKKSLDMALRHMDIRRTIPSNLRPLMTKIPASSMHSTRSGNTKGRTGNVCDSPLATSSNASSEASVNYTTMYVHRHETDDEGSSDKGIHSPSNLRGR